MRRQLTIVVLLALTVPGCLSIDTRGPAMGTDYFGHNFVCREPQLPEHYTANYEAYRSTLAEQDRRSEPVFAVIAGLSVALVQITLDLPPLLMLLVGGLGGGGIYVLLHWVFKSDEFRLLLEDLMPRAYKMILKS